MAEVKAKAWYRSSTVWINLIPAALVVIDLVVKSNLIPDADVIAILAALANILNRLRAPKVVQPLKLL